MLWRSCKILGHEACHILGMNHCIYYRCLMNGVNNLEENDATIMQLCPVCLRKLHKAVEFDVEQRYEELREFTRLADFDIEEEWLSERLEFITGRK